MNEGNEGMVNDGPKGDGGGGGRGSQSLEKAMFLRGFSFFQVSC
jgi:hypothetical protein